MTDAMVEGLGPLLEALAQASVVVATVVVCWRMFNSTWATAAKTLRESADYARDESAELRERVERLEADANRHALERAEWVVERSQFQHHISVLEAKVAALERQTQGDDSS